MRLLFCSDPENPKVVDAAYEREASTRAANWRTLETTLGASLPHLEHPKAQAFPRITRQYEAEIALACWIAEHYPERVEWLPVSCECAAQKKAADKRRNKPMSPTKASP